MPTRFSGLQVTFKTNMRDDDAEALIDAIRQLRHVVDVRPIVADSLSSESLQVRMELATRLSKLAQEMIGLPENEDGDGD